MGYSNESGDGADRLADGQTGGYAACSRWADCRAATRRGGGGGGVSGLGRDAGSASSCLCQARLHSHMVRLGST